MAPGGLEYDAVHTVVVFRDLDLEKIVLSRYKNNLICALGRDHVKRPH